MSLQAIEWAFAQDIGSSAAKFLLVCLADNAAADGVCYPSLELMCKKTNQDRKTVISNLDLLENLGLISESGRKVGNGVKVYRLVGLPNNKNHYCYMIVNKNTHEFYIGVRSCDGAIIEDKYIGTGSWSLKQSRENTVKTIIGVYKTRKEAELAELFFIDKHKENPMIRNKFIPKQNSVPISEPVPISTPVPILEPVPILDYSSTKNGTHNRNEPSITVIEPSISITQTKEPKFDFRSELLNLGVSADNADDWLIVRKNKKASNTKSALMMLVTQARIAGISVNDAVNFAAGMSWSGFKADWYTNARASPTKPTNGLHSGFKERDYTSGINPDGSF